MGKWQESGSAEILEFLPDGTYTTGPGVAGTYKFIAKDKLKLEFGGLFGLAGPLVVTTSVAGDEMTWTTPDGRTSKFRRVK